MEEESRKKDLEKNINKKIEECDSIIKVTSKAMKGLNPTQQKILFAKENLESTNYNAKWNKNILSNLRANKFIKNRDNTIISLSATIHSS